MNVIDILLVVVLEALLIVPFFYLIIKRKTDIFSPIIIFIAIYGLYFGFPSLFYLFSKQRFIPDSNYIYILAPIYEIIGIVCFYLGYYFVYRYRHTIANFFKTKSIITSVKNFLTREPNIRGRFIILNGIGFTLISIISLFVYMHAVGGFHYYLTHLGATNV